MRIHNSHRHLPSLGNALVNETKPREIAAIAAAIAAMAALWLKVFLGVLRTKK
jgi:hypothetical protein